MVSLNSCRPLFFLKVSKYDFYKTIDVSATNNKLQDLIHSEEAISLGQELLLQDLIDHHGFQEYLNYKDQWVEKLEHVLLDEVYIIGTVVKEIAEENNLSVKMKIFMLKELGSEKVHDVLKKWEEICDEKMMKAVYDFIYTDNHLLGIVFDNSSLNFKHLSSKRQINEQNIISDNML